MLTIRFTRKGKKNQPFFRVVVIDKRRSAKGGRAVEILGYVDPLTKRKSLKKERVLHWMKVGAKPSATVHNLLVSEKIIEGKKINLSKKSKKPVEAQKQSPAVPVAESKSEPKPAETAVTAALEKEATSEPEKKTVDETEKPPQ